MDVRLWSRTDDSRRIRRPLVPLCLWHSFISTSTFPWLSDFLRELYLFTFFSPSFYLTKKRVCLLNCVFKLRCLDLVLGNNIYLIKRRILYAKTAREGFCSMLKVHLIWCVVWYCTRVGNLGFHANGACLTRVLCVKRVGKCFVRKN